MYKSLHRLGDGKGACVLKRRLLVASRGVRLCILDRRQKMAASPSWGEILTMVNETRTPDDSVNNTLDRLSEVPPLEILMTAAGKEDQGWLYLLLRHYVTYMHLLPSSTFKGDKLDFSRAGAKASPSSPLRRMGENPYAVAPFPPLTDDFCLKVVACRAEHPKEFFAGEHFYEAFRQSVINRVTIIPHRSAGETSVQRVEVNYTRTEPNEVGEIVARMQFGEVMHVASTSDRTHLFSFLRRLLMRT